MPTSTSRFSRVIFLTVTISAAACSLQAAQFSMSLSRSVASVPETAAAPAIVFTIYIGGSRSFPLEIPYQLIAGRAGGAHYGIDYVADPVEPVTGGTLARPGLVVVNPGADRVQLRFRVKPDNFYEGPQSLNFSTMETPLVEFAPGSPRWMEVEINDTEASNTRWLARAFPLPGTVTGLSLWALNADGLPTRTTGPDYSWQIDKFGGTSRSLALGRLDSTGWPGAVIGSGGGAIGQVTICSLSPTGYSAQHWWRPYDNFTVPVNVATGDVDGDGLDEVITGAGQLGGPHVRIWKVSLLDNMTVTWTHQLMRDYFAFDAAFTGGVRVACGDVDGDGRADIITAMGPGSFPYVTTQSGATGLGIPGASYFPYALDFTGGVYVSAADLDGDGRAEIITGAGDGGARHIRAYNVATRSYLVDRVEPGLATGVEVAALPHTRRNGSENRGGILYAQPASQYFSFRPTTAETAGSAAPWAVNAGAEMVINDLTPIRQSLAAYQVPGKPPYVFDFTTLEPTLEMTSITPTEIRYRFPTVAGHGYDIWSAYYLDSLIWRREGSITGDGLPHEFVQPILPDQERQFLRLRAVNWAFPPSQARP